MLEIIDKKTLDKINLFGLLVNFISGKWKFVMGAFAVQNTILEDSESRKDSRIIFNGKKPVVAECFTDDSHFKASIQDLCTSGVFICTDRKFSIGQEISLTLWFPESGKKMMASGEIVRIEYSGIGVKFKILFSK